ncbi:hypothetical protein EKO27_g4938 [Xylaria grammica]|uniref:Uncharacterized protein n=1 Tax=Xylaria grammica TaxID=363999 RepID=A0A439D6Z4_9PEZI|nr:hypothetical protein EKO27_g4938 [Xylaria grammica]
MSLPPPDNLDDIFDALVQPRPVLSREDFQKFKQADADAFKETQVVSTVIPIIEGEVGDGKSVAGQVPFTNLEHLTDGFLVPGNPDRYYGARPEQLDRQVRTQLGGHIVPSTQHNLPIAPNFFLTAKGPDGTLSIAKRQACYDGALGARGMKSLRAYGDPGLHPDNKAYTLTSIYHGGTLTIYASYPLSRGSLGMRCEYATTQINGYALTGNIDAFRTGVSAYRNARDWARQKRDEAIERANEAAAVRSRHNLPAVGLDYDRNSDSDSDSDSDANIPPAKRARKFRGRQYASVKSEGEERAIC